MDQQVSYLISQKMNEMRLFSQISSYFENVISKYHYDFRQGLRVQYVITYVIQK